MGKEVVKDTLASVSKNENLCADGAKYLSEHEIIIVPLLLLVIIYALKYFFGNNFNKKSFMEFILEFPVDFGFIGITFVFTYFFLDLKIAVFGRLMILLCIIIAILNSTIRRFAISEYEKDSCNNLALGFYGILNTCISIIFVYFILNSIQHN